MVSRVSSKDNLHQQNSVNKYRKKIAVAATSEEGVSKVESEASLNSVTKQTQEMIERIVA
jgi:hypothetical protein